MYMVSAPNANIARAKHDTLRWQGVTNGPDNVHSASDRRLGDTVEDLTDSKRSVANNNHYSYEGGRPGWMDPAFAADEVLMSVAPADRYGFPGWSTVILAGKPVRHFPSIELANAFIRGRDRTYSLAELAEACTVAYARGMAVAQVGRHPVSLGSAGAALFPTLRLPVLLTTVEWSHELGEGQPGWEIAEEQANTVMEVLAERERKWQALLLAVDDMVAWLATQTSPACPGTLSRAITAAAAPLRTRLEQRT